MKNSILEHSLVKEIRNCKICAAHLPHGINPIVSFSTHSRIAVVGQAPGRIVHETGIPWNDKSGERLRKWMDVTDAQFYDPRLFALIPMGFCYPGTGKSGDLPPRKECAPAWHTEIFNRMKQLSLIILIGKYATNYYLPDVKINSLTQIIKDYSSFLPGTFILPHPSPRNNIWLKKNEWFEKEVIPHMQQIVAEILNHK